MLVEVKDVPSKCPASQRTWALSQHLSSCHGIIKGVTKLFHSSRLSWPGCNLHSEINVEFSNYFRIQAYIILLHCTLLHFTDNVLLFLFLTNWRFGQTCMEYVYWHHVSIAFAQFILCVTFWQFLQYLNVFIVIIFAMVIYNPLYLVLLMELF